jgi:acetyl esterase/lipase
MNPARETYNLSYGDHPLQKMDVHFPEGYTTSTPIAFLIHGGGFVAGQKEDFTPQAALMCREGFVTVNLSHRLVDTDGLYSNPPLHRAGSVKIIDQLADVAASVEMFYSQSEVWGVGDGPMYMAGHSAGAILALLYVQGENNRDGRIKASGNWAGSTDLSLPADTIYNYLPAPERKQIAELYYRGTGYAPLTVNNSAFRTISPIWAADKNGGRPNISIYPEHNVVNCFPQEEVCGLENTRKFHELLRSRGIPEQLHVYAGADHGFHTPADVWPRCIRETAIFFKAVSHIGHA